MFQKYEQIKLAAKLLHLSEVEVDEYGDNISDIGALYVSIPEKGGASIIIGNDGTVLYADSSVGYSRHLHEFNTGRRTPLEEFEQ